MANAEEKTMYLIKHLPLELREEIYKEFIYSTIKQKNEKGFESIHFSLKRAPYCSLNEQILKVTICRECLFTELYFIGDTCSECELTNENINNLCYFCYKKGIFHYISSDYFYEPEFLVYLEHKLTPRQSLLKRIANNFSNTLLPLLLQLSPE